MSEHVITELELQCKSSTTAEYELVHVIVYFFMIDVLTHPNSLQWKAYTLKYANGESRDDVIV